MQTIAKDTWQGREVLERKLFKSTGEDFVAHSQACSHLRNLGYTLGSMQRDAPIAFMKETRDEDGELYGVDKWRYISDEDLKTWVDGVMLPIGSLGFREWDTEILIFGGVVGDVTAPTAADDMAEILRVPDPDEVVLYEVIDRIKYLVKTGELGDFISEGNTRQCYQHAKNPNLVIKIPRPWREEDADYQSLQEFETFLHEEINKEIVESAKITRVAFCSWDKRTRILIMQKLTPIPGTKNLWLDSNGIAKVYDIF